MVIHKVSDNVDYPKSAKRLEAVIGNVWEWVFEISDQSPIQPIANLGHGMIEFNPPTYLIEAHQQALLKVDCNQYGPSMGRARLKRALANTYSPIYAKTINSEKEIAITTGATAGVLSVLMAFIEPGDEVIMIEPLFNLYEYIVKFIEGVVRTVTLHPPANVDLTRTSADDWVLNMDELKAVIGPRTKMLIINTPHNPLGKVFSVPELLAVGSLCVAHNIVMLSDEVYEHLAYTTTFPRLATLGVAIASRTITIGSVGKTFNATGWRVGYAIGNENLIRHVQWAHVLLAYVTPGPAQEAAAVAYEQADVQHFWADNKQLFKRKINELTQFLDWLGLPYVVPSGAYFIFLNISSMVIPRAYVFPPVVAEKGKDWKLCWYLCQELGVSSVPGSAFFSEKNSLLGEHFLRLIVCKTDDQLDLAKSRLQGLRKLFPDYRSSRL